MKRIERTISIEDLVTYFPAAVRILINKGLPCLVCGEPTWGTLEELARDKGWAETEIDLLIEELNHELAAESVT